MNRVILDPRNPLHLVPATLATNPELVVVLPVFSPHDPNSTLVLSAKRHRRRIPPDLAVKIAQAQAAESGNGSERVELPTHMEVGRVLLTVPADVAENLRGPAQDRHPVYLFMVHRSAYDAAIRQAETGIILPSTGIPTANDAGPRIVKP